jgi:5-oxoprolinase (ATP-hydrolysing) subunit C
VPMLVGPDASEELLAAIAAATFVISAASDRTGTRLEGPALPYVQNARDRKSTPMVRGAIEVTPAGLVVLGPDHPTTGGYPVAGIVHSHAIGDLFALPIGARIRFEKTALKVT